MEAQVRQKSDNEMTETRELVTRVLKEAASRPPLTSDDSEFIQSPRKPLPAKTPPDKKVSP
jgi:hypothetical protein